MITLITLIKISEFKARQGQPVKINKSIDIIMAQIEKNKQDLEILRLKRY